MKYLIIVFLTAFTFGCKPTENLDITTQDIASALDMHKWTIKMPVDTPDSKQLGLRLTVNHDEENQQLMTLNRGETTRLIIWRNDDTELFNFYFKNSDGSFSTSVLRSDSFIGTSPVFYNTDQILTIGDKIMQGKNYETGDIYEVTISLEEYID